ncbi:MAG: glycosyltransferase [Acidobacteria bacterium RIFCSPLOWO2_02_FULL_59_13]|nr:MAG: glycosyltransferase [Acidobacteria bacterium RIFCSPLOWO2_02_FULL_59_13]
MRTPYISVVTPIYGCRAALLELYDRLASVLSTISADYEIIMVNDSSLDDAWEVIKKLASDDRRVKGINLSRNFGQHYAITAGLDYAQGDWVVVMDCDLQHKPEEIPKLYQKAQEGYDLVVGMRAERQDTYLKKLGSRLFYRVFAYLTGSRIDNRLSNFGIYSRKVIQSITALREQSRAFGLLALWVGFRRIEIDIEHASRPYGKSAYTFRRMMGLALDSILSHSDRVLLITVKLGLFLSFTSLLYATWVLVRYFYWATPVEGWTSLIVSIYFTAGLIIGSIGVVGLYVGKIFNEVKGRPLYFIDSATFELSSPMSRPRSSGDVSEP